MRAESFPPVTICGGNMLFWIFDDWKYALLMADTDGSDNPLFWAGFDHINGFFYCGF
jgi:hypothetical protein